MNKNSNRGEKVVDLGRYLIAPPYGQYISITSGQSVGYYKWVGFGYERTGYFTP